MGWWSTNEDGVSFAKAEGEEMAWGDGPADVIDAALAEIDRLFQEAYGRDPSVAELVAGLNFSLGPRRQSEEDLVG